MISHLGYNSFFPIFAAALTIFADAMPWWWNGRHEGLKSNLSALSERRDVECRKFKETLTGKADGNLEPSLVEEEGAETRHDTPKDR